MTGARAAKPAARRTNTEIYNLLIDMAQDVAHLKLIVGQENDRGNGGAGLAGKLARVGTEVAALTALKQQALGAIAAVTLLSFIILLGFRSWLQQLIGAPHAG